ncbi:putative uncharacterized protein DDB_G0282133 [Achroia grisella]|uniref:putative uncharacterized protein DDB_G0282133 n=1 Tax=Achroia grisella TaxID=688607 RepID=UPI0027D33A5C|nr:putative uncharacterized protein DDB_G0282133 [Achroia grisella]
MKRAIGNPLTQLLPLLSGNCNQNSFIQPTSSPASSIPFLPQAASYNGPYSQQLPGYNVPNLPQAANNNNLLQLLNQNQMSPDKCFCNKLPQNPIVGGIKDNAINQLYANKIMTNPMFQRILGPNAKPNQNGVDSLTESINVPNNDVVPNIINNYYILPPEYLEAIEQDLKKNLRSSKRYQREENTKHTSGRIISSVNNNRKPSESNRSKKKITNTRHHDNPLEIKPKHKNRDNGQKERGGTRKSGRKEKNEHIENKRSKATNDTDINEYFEKNINKTNPIKKNNELSNETNNTKNNKGDNDLKSNFSKNRDESIIKDIHRKFPGIPEEVIRKLISYLRRQYQNQQLGIQDSSKNTRFYKTNKKNNNKDENRSKSQNSNGKNKEHIKDKNKINTTMPNSEISDPGYTTTDVNLLQSSISTTTERITKFDNTGKITNITNKKTTSTNMTDLFPKNKLIDVLVTTQIPNVHKTLQPVLIETTTAYNLEPKIPNLGEEDTINEIENFVDDYYPNFIADNKYIESNEDNFRNNMDNKFLVTHNTETSTAIAERDENITNPITEISIDFNDYTENTIFQTPPVLENPNFETKPVDRSTKIDDQHYYEHEFKKDNDEVIRIYLGNPNDKLSSYSDTKSSKYNDSKYVKVSTKKPTNIETVFAKSKVVKYGQNEDHYEEETTTVKYNLPLINRPVLVFAKSIPSGDV